MDTLQNPQIGIRIHNTDQEIPADELRELKRIYCRAALRAYLKQLEQEHPIANVKGLGIL